MDFSGTFLTVKETQKASLLRSGIVVNIQMSIAFSFFFLNPWHVPVSVVEIVVYNTKLRKG